MDHSLTESLAELESRLSEVAGCASVSRAPLAPHTTLRIGGPADFLVRIRTEIALTRIVQIVARTSSPFRILGLGSNVLVPDQGLRGIVAILEGDFREYRFDGLAVEAGAGLPLSRLAQVTVEHGLAGLEALAGFPSTVGGAVVMNAGCYGVEIKDVLESVRVLHPDGTSESLGPSRLEAGYRSTRLQGSPAVVVGARFKLSEDPGNARERLVELNRKRWQSMPSGRPNAGSVFKNPPGDYAGRLIERCGLKGVALGGARISAEHANVIVNTGGAKADDVFGLMAMMYRSVLARFQLELEPELILTGGLVERWSSLARDQAVS
jgi:UDP-N-acetylmuramate dehydrogenase